VFRERVSEIDRVRINYYFDEMAHVERTGGAGGAWAGIRGERTKLRGYLRESIPRAIDQLEGALGRGSDETAVA
jgi:hypothetical protein